MARNNSSGCWGRALGTKGVEGDNFSVMHGSSRVLEYCMIITLK